MDVRNCLKCGRIFTYAMGKPICPNCKKDLEVKFTEVRTFVRKNTHASLVEVAEATGTDVRQIKEWIREERLSFSKDSAIGIDCEVCGKTIKTGRFCDTCKASMGSDLKQSIAPAKSTEVPENPFARKDTGSRMRYGDKE